MLNTDQVDVGGKSMRYTHLKYAVLLTYLGVLPFYLSAIAVFFNFNQNHAVFLFRSYGAMIVSFIAGIHWTISVKDINNKAFWLIWTSNIIALMGWSSIIINNAIYGLYVLAMALLLLIYIDYKLFKLQQIELWFIKLRWRATLLVIISMIFLIENLP